MEINFNHKEAIPDFMPSDYFQLKTNHEENLSVSLPFTTEPASSSMVNNLLAVEGESPGDPSYPGLSFFSFKEPETERLKVEKEGAHISSSVDITEDMVDSRFLPHKKRIPRKLKSISSDEKELGIQFTCEICGHCALSQLDFFSHLKGHYEPIPENMSSMKTLLDATEPKTHVPHLCLTPIKEVEVSVAEVLNLHFDNFRNDIHESGSNNDVKILNSSCMEKCMEEIEFSDTEDMLEGIRNVVDKVSIEDSCDEIDLISSNGLREHWFGSNNFPGIAQSPLKADVSFSTAFAQILGDDIPEVCQTLKENESQKLSDIVSFCSEKQSDNLETETLNSTFKSQSILCNADELTTNSNGDTDSQTSCSRENQYIEKIKKKHFYCEECNREFNSGNALKYHNQTHKGIRPYKCNTCGRCFFVQGALTSHMRIHTGEKPYECEYCQQKFRQWSDLNYHITSIHSSEKSHQCEFCGALFSRKYSLVLHIRIHEKEKNYKCEFCDKAFRASTYLQKHRKIHTGERPHECKVCSKRFRVFGDLRRHFRIHQRNESQSNKSEKKQSVNPQSIEPSTTTD